MTPAQRKVLSSRKLGVLEKEVEVTPGDDELLLHGASARKRESLRLTKDGVQSAGLRQAISASPPLPKEPPSPSQRTIMPRLNEPGVDDMSFDAIGDLGDADGWVSDNDTEVHSSDIEAGPEDTFIHANHRPLARDLSTQGTLRPLSPLLEDEFRLLDASHAARLAQIIGEVRCEAETGVDPPAVLYASDTHEDAPSISFSTGQPVFEDPEISMDSPSFDCSADPSFSSDGSTQIEVDIPEPNDERIRDVTPSQSIAAASHPPPGSIEQDDDEVALARLLREIHEEEALPGSTPAKPSPASRSPSSHSSPSTSLAGDLTEDGISGSWDDPSTLDPPDAESLEHVQEKEDAASPRKDVATNQDDETPSLHFEPLPSPRRTPARIIRAETIVNGITPLQNLSSVMSVLPTTGQEASPDDAEDEASVHVALPADDKVSAHCAISREGSPVEQTNADTSTLASEDRADLGHHDHTDQADRTDDAASDAWDMSGAARDEDRAEFLHHDDHEPILHFEPLPSPRRTPVILRTREKTEPIEELNPAVDFRMRRANSLAPRKLPVLIRRDEIPTDCPIDLQPQPAHCEAIESSAGQESHAEEVDAADYDSPDIEEDTPCEADAPLSNGLDLSLDTPNIAPTAAEDSCSSAHAADQSITAQVEDPSDETQVAISREWDETGLDLTHPSHNSSLDDHLRGMSDRDADVVPNFEAFAAGVPDQSEDDQSLETPGEEAADIEVDGSGILDDDVGTDHETTDEEASDEEEQEYAAPKSDEKLVLRLVLRSPVKVESETITILPATTASLAEETSHPTAPVFMTAEAAPASNADPSSAAIECPVLAAEPSTSEQIPLAAACSSLALPSASPPPKIKASSSCSLAAVDTETPQQSVFKHANANAAHGVASLEWMLARRSLPIASQASSHPPSRLSKEVLPSSSPSHHSQAEPSVPSTPLREERSDLRVADVSTETAQDSMSSADSSIRQSAPSRSLLDEMSRAEADESMRSVVEVSSLDPRAAARAAAILKLVSTTNRSWVDADCRIMRISSMAVSPRPLQILPRQRGPLPSIVRTSSTRLPQHLSCPSRNYYLKRSWKSLKPDGLALGPCRRPRVSPAILPTCPVGG